MTRSLCSTSISPAVKAIARATRFGRANIAVLAATPWGVLGMTICYDLRFPHLYRSLAQAGADFLAIPSSFTVPTGKAHWHVLMRARAIENGCFVLAPAQWGEHAERRQTYGHSLIVDPWGEVLADAGEGVGIVSATIQPARVAEVRRMLPSLSHDRRFLLRAWRRAPSSRIIGWPPRSAILTHGKLVLQLAKWRGQRLWRISCPMRGRRRAGPGLMMGRLTPETGAGVSGESVTDGDR